MRSKKKTAIFLIPVICICLFFAFGFQIDVNGVAGKEGGTVEVSPIDTLRSTADEANAAVEKVQLALEEAQASLVAVKLIVANPEEAVAAAQKSIDEAQAFLDSLALDDPQLVEAQIALKEAQAALVAVELIVVDPEAAVKSAEQALIDAKAALEAAILVAEEANTAYSGFKTIDEEELKELQLAVEEAQVALDEAIMAGGGEEEIAELRKVLDEAKAELEQGESGENKPFHFITNSNNGGSFDMEGNYSSEDEEIIPYTFTAEEGFELVWLRVGNIKILTSDLENLFEFSFDKKNLAIHAHFKKDKDYTAESIIEETSVQQKEGDGSSEDFDNGKSNGNVKDNDNKKGKDKEKSNNGKKNKNK